MASADGRKPTCYPNGLNMYRASVAGGSAGDHSIDSSYGIEVGDLIHQVESITIGTDGSITTAVDITSEFGSLCVTANTINNTGGTDTTGSLIVVTWYDADAGEGTL